MKGTENPQITPSEWNQRYSAAVSDAAHVLHEHCVRLSAGISSDYGISSAAVLVDIERAYRAAVLI